MDRNEELDWFLSQPFIHAKSIHDESPQELIAHKDQLTHVTNAFRLYKCTQKENPGHLKGSGSSLMGVGQS